MAILYFRLLFDITNGDFFKLLECLPFIIFIMVVAWGGLLSELELHIDSFAPDFNVERLIYFWVG